MVIKKKKCKRHLKKKEVKYYMNSVSVNSVSANSVANEVANRKIETFLWQLQNHLSVNISVASPKKIENVCKYISELAELQNEYVTSRIKTIIGYKKQLEHVNSLPQVKQRSEEWYELRKNMLTASDTAQALGLSKYSKQSQLVTKKAFPEKNNMNGMVIPALRHGIVYESMALRCYQQRHANMKIHEFGLIPHPQLDCYGASPDGITDFGIMIEIKCPLKRVIDGTIPDNYYFQMQGQMAVCSLNECDYIECDIQEFTDSEEYLKQLDSNATLDHGALIIDPNKEQIEYSEALLTPREVVAWTTSYQEGVFYWKLRKISVQRVYFSPEKWKEYEIGIKEFWEKVETARAQKAKQTSYAFLDDDDL